MLDVVMLNVELPVFVTETGLKLALTPAGRPAMLNPTTPVNPLLVVTLTV